MHFIFYMYVIIYNQFATWYDFTVSSWILRVYNDDNLECIDPFFPVAGQGTLLVWKRMLSKA